MGGLGLQMLEGSEEAYLHRVFFFFFFWNVLCPGAQGQVSL